MPYKEYIARILCLFLLIAVVVNTTGCCKRKIKMKMSKADTYLDEMNQDAEKETEEKTAPTEPTKVMKGTGLNFSIAPSEPVKPISIAPAGMSFFENNYRKGVSYMETGDYIKAIEIFKQIIAQYPDSEEASVSYLCLADMYFALKNDKKDIEYYKIIVEKFPLTPAAENAKAAIQYLQDFKKYEKEHIPIDKYDRDGGRRR